MLKPELLDILCCPQCKGDLQLLEEQSLLRCTACERTYEVKDGIPIMLVKE